MLWHMTWAVDVAHSWAQNFLSHFVVVVGGFAAADVFNSVTAAVHVRVCYSAYNSSITFDQTRSSHNVVQMIVVTSQERITCIRSI